MILVDVEQRTPEWFEARAGVITSSRVKDVFAKPTTLAYRNLMAEIANEIITGKCSDEGGYSNHWMQRGTELETDARAALAFERGYDIHEAGFVLHDDHARVGASPDGLVGIVDGAPIANEEQQGSVEIKCPKLSTHITYLQGGSLPSDYTRQCTHLLWVTGAKWLDFASYHPDAFKTLFVYRLERDKAGIDEHAETVLDFITKAEALAEQLKALAA